MLNGSNNENSKFATKKWYVIDSESKGNYSHENSVKFLTSSLESNLCDYSDAYILVTGNITVTRTNAAAAGGNAPKKQPHDAATEVIFKNHDHLKIVEQKLRVLLLIMQIFLILPCLCTILLNIVGIILILQEVYEILKETK